MNEKAAPTIPETPEGESLAVNDLPAEPGEEPRTEAPTPAPEAAETVAETAEASAHPEEDATAVTAGPEVPVADGPTEEAEEQTDEALAAAPAEPAVAEAADAGAAGEDDGATDEKTAESGAPVAAAPADGEGLKAEAEQEEEEEEEEEEETGSGEIATLRQAKESQTAVEGKVIGWNNGGFHVVIGELTAFCPRSEMEISAPKAPRNYVDKSFKFQVLKVQKKGRRVVLSRASLLRGERSKQRDEIRERLSPGSVVTGKVASLTDFGAFVDLGGVQGLVHVSEISRNRVNSPADVLQVGQDVQVKVLKLEKGGRRISLSMRALEPDPWREVKERFPEGSTQIGKVEKATTFGAFIELEPGLTGLLPLSAMSIPRDTSPARVYPPGKEVKVIVMSVDSRRRRISLALEGSTLEGTRNDYKSYQKEQSTGGTGSGFNALAAAFKRLDADAD